MASLKMVPNSKKSELAFLVCSLLQRGGKKEQRRNGNIFDLPKARRGACFLVLACSRTRQTARGVRRQRGFKGAKEVLATIPDFSISAWHYWGVCVPG